MKSLLDPSLDDDIRDALRVAKEKGQLGVVAAVTGIAGGVDELVKIMESNGELSVVDRGTLAMYLNRE